MSQLELEIEFNLTFIKNLLNTLSGPNTGTINYPTKPVLPQHQPSLTYIGNLMKKFLDDAKPWIKEKIQTEGKELWESILTSMERTKICTLGYAQKFVNDVKELIENIKELLKEEGKFENTGQDFPGQISAIETACELFEQRIMPEAFELRTILSKAGAIYIRPGRIENRIRVEPQNISITETSLKIVFQISPEELKRFLSNPVHLSVQKADSKFFYSFPLEGTSYLPTWFADTKKTVLKYAKFFVRRHTEMEISEESNCEKYDPIIVQQNAFNLKKQSSRQDENRPTSPLRSLSPTKLVNGLVKLVFPQEKSKGKEKGPSPPRSQI